MTISPALRDIPWGSVPPTREEPATPWTVHVAGLFVAESFLAKSAVMQFLPEASLLIVHYALSAILLAVLAFARLSSRRAGGRWRDDTMLLLLVSGIAAWMLGGAFFHGETLFQLAAVGGFVALAWGTVYVIPRLALAAHLLALDRWLWHLCRGFTVVSVGSLLWFPAPVFDVSGRFFGACGNVAVASGIFLVCAAYFLADWLSPVPRPKSWLYLLGSLVCVALTGSRSSLLPLVIVCGAMMLSSFIWRRGTQRKLLAALMALLGIFGYLAGDEDAWGLARRAFRLDARTDSRTMNWNYGLERVQGSEWMGLGLLSRHTAQGSFGDNLRRGSAGYSQIHDPHNAFIYALQVGGYPLVLGFLLLTGLAAARAIQALRSAVLNRDKFIVFAACFTLIYLSTALASPAFLTLGNFLDRMFWLCLGLISFARQNQAGFRWEQDRSRWLAVGKTMFRGPLGQRWAEAPGR
jgi:O-antigen ligase